MLRDIRAYPNLYSAEADNLPDIFWPPRELAVWMQGRYRWRQLSIAVQENRSAEYPSL